MAPRVMILFGLWMLACNRSQVETLSLKGSDTEVNLVLQLAEAYMETDPLVSINVTGGGSGVGIAGLLNGKTDIANSSRELNTFELELASARGILMEPFVFAADALVIICHPEVALDSLQLNTLGQLFSGQIPYWSDLGLKAGKVSLYGRQSNSGTFIYFREKVLGTDYAASLKQMNGNAQILEAVKADPNAIGYIGLGYVTDETGALRSGIKAIRLSAGKGQHAVSPLDKNALRAGMYPLTRPLYQFTNGKPGGKTLAFFEFEKSEKGQNILLKNGYLPASEAGLAHQH